MSRTSTVRRHVRHLAPRATVLAAIGALTVVVPAAGFATVETEAPTAVAPVATVEIGQSALDILDAAAESRALDAVGAPRVLADPVAPVRASAAIASRAGARENFLGRRDVGASGTRAALIPDAPVVMPLASGSSNLTSRYGQRIHPISRIPSMHTGTDFSAPVGTPIHAITDGTVTYVGPGRDGRSGMIIILEHDVDGETFYSWYNHMYSDGLYVGVGDEVMAGTVIGAVGNNGNSTGPHLHFEIHTDTELTTVDSLAWLTEHGAVDVGSID
ncbi:M23 family metallopeptidase [Georgenia wangjunii]|uniref:M23 family metallopeptidase n=1 Tax=Georgenia wangjunii TaxID=3117730 RepID=UPI002F25F88E